jgi:hypothetical protein
VGIIQPAQAPSPPAPVPDGAAPADAAIRFTVPWAGAAFAVDAGAADGTLIVVRGVEGSVSAEIAGAGASLTFVPLGVRVEGPGSPETVYTIALPPSVEVLRLTYDGRTRSVRVDGSQPLRLPLR